MRPISKPASRKRAKTKQRVTHAAAPAPAQGHIQRKAKAVSLGRGYDPYIIGGYLTLVLLVVGIGGWASASKIESAVIAPGAVIVEGKAKTVQHLNGGIIKDIFVKDSDFVTKGDVILSLDPTVVNAATDFANSGYFETLAEIDRLSAERDGRAQILWSSEIRAHAGDPETRLAQGGQVQLFEARRQSYYGRVQQLEQRTAQSRDQMRGINAQSAAIDAQANSIAQELVGLRELLAERLIPKSRVVTLDRELSSLRGRLSENQASVARLTNVVAETQTAIVQTRREWVEAILTDLRAAQAKLSTYTQQRASANDISARIDITAPTSGYIHKFTKTTLGGVILPGEEILQIIPKGQRLVVEARINPQDIDKVELGQVSNVRFSAFNQRKTPEIPGQIASVSPERLSDPITGMTYFNVNVSFDPKDMERLKGQQLLPGMPAEVFIKTGTRSALSYMVKPAQDAMNLSMREE